MKCNFNLFIYHLFLEEWLHCEKKTSMAHESEWNDCCCHHVSLFADRCGANVRTAGVGGTGDFDTKTCKQARRINSSRRVAVTLNVIKALNAPTIE